MIRSRHAAIAVVALAGLLSTACGTQDDERPAHPPAATAASTPAVRAAAAPVAVPTTAPAVVTTPASSAPTAPNPCAGNETRQLVTVRLRVQHLWMCEREHLVYSTAITSGIPGEYTSTPTGTYTIQGRDRNTVLTINTGKTYDVKYWIPFDAPLFGFHDSSWQHFPYGSQQYRTDGSHGCVHMPLQAIAFLYRWVDIGAKVRIRD